MPRTRLTSNALGAVGAVAGGVVGFFLFGWLIERGFLAPFLPGVLIGFGCSLLARHRSIRRGVGCGVGAMILGLYAIWWNRGHVDAPGLSDASFLGLLTHLQELPPMYPLFIVVGGGIAFWLGHDHLGAGLGSPSGRSAV